MAENTSTECPIWKRRGNPLVEEVRKVLRYVYADQISFAYQGRILGGALWARAPRGHQRGAKKKGKRKERERGEKRKKDEKKGIRKKKGRKREQERKKKERKKVKSI